MKTFYNDHSNISCFLFWGDILFDKKVLTVQVAHTIIWVDFQVANLNTNLF